MRFLVDQNLSPVIAEHLRSAGHDAVHTGDIDLATADDRRIIAIAAQQDRTVLSADTDFGTLLAESSATSPSVDCFGSAAHAGPNNWPACSWPTSTP